MKKASVALLVSFAAPVVARIGQAAPAPPRKVLKRTDESFERTDKNDDGVVDRHEFIGRREPAGAPAPAIFNAGAPAPVQPKEPEVPDNSIPRGLTPEPEPEERVLTWPEDVMPGNKHTMKNVSFNPENKTVQGIWNTENTSAWRDDDSKMPECKECKASKSKDVENSVEEAMKPSTTAAPVKVDSPALTAARSAMQDGAHDESVVEAAAAGGSGKKLQAVTLTFELRNINYFMLDEPASRSPALGHFNKAQHLSMIQGNGPVDVEPPTLEDTPHEATNGELIQEAIKTCLEQLMAIAFGEVGSIHVGEPVPSAQQGHVNIGHTVLALFQKGVRHALEKSHQPHKAPEKKQQPRKEVKTSLVGMAPAPAAMVAAAPGPAMAAREAPAGPPLPLALPKMGVTFFPGRNVDEEAHSSWLAGKTEAALVARHSSRNHHIRGSASGYGHHVESMTTVVEVDLVEAREEPRHSIDDVRKVLAMYLLDGTLTEAVAAAIAQVIHMKPTVGVIEEDTGTVVPYNVSACARHMHNLVDSFTHAYTRRQTIPALFHACTHYAQKHSFSHDIIIDNADKRKCRAATKKFSHLWQYGKGQVDYARFCLSLCELRHGLDAIHCDAYKHLR